MVVSWDGGVRILGIRSNSKKMLVSNVLSVKFLIVVGRYGGKLNCGGGYWVRRVKDN
jgi:hypothetical protein